MEAYKLLPSLTLLSLVVACSGQGRSVVPLRGVTHIQRVNIPWHYREWDDAEIACRDWTKNQGLTQELAMMAKSQTGPARSDPLLLIPETLPQGAPAGWRAFRFFSPNWVERDTVCAIVSRNGENGFVYAWYPEERTIVHGLDPKHLDEYSHILVPPSGYVSPELIAKRAHE